jgi:endonuclease I
MKGRRTKWRGKCSRLVRIEQWRGDERRAHFKEQKSRKEDCQMHLLCLSYLTCDSPRDSAPYYWVRGKGKEREGKGGAWIRRAGDISEARITVCTIVLRM